MQAAKGGLPAARRGLFLAAAFGCLALIVPVGAVPLAGRGSSRATAVSAPAGLVAAYSFNAGAGTTVADVSGNGNNGSVSNAAWSAAGKFGGALSFNGSSSWVTVPDAASLDLTRMTLEAWVRPASLNAWRTLIIKEQPGELVYALYANNIAGRPNGIVYIGGESELDGTAKLPLSAWTHLAASYDGATLRLYVNGTQVASRSVTGSMPNSAGALRIGGNSVWGEWFDGLIDEVRIYNRALTAAEIQADMNTPVTQVPDTTAPSQPSGFVGTGSSTTSVSTAWQPSTDDVGVTGYNLYQGGVNVGSTSATSFTFSGLSCGTSYGFGVEAYDAAGNVSARTSLTASTAACPETNPPTVPTGLSVTGATATSITVSWAASTDDVGVAGYGLYRDGTSVGTSSTTTATFGGLGCGTTYTLGVDAFDAAGNHSAQTTMSAATDACDVTPPSVSITAPLDGATVSSTVSVSATASDDRGVAGVQFTLDGANLGAEDQTAPYELAWATTAAANGAHVLGAVARDAAGNTATAAAVGVTVANALNTADARKRVDVGPGLVDASARAVVRTAGGRVYIFAADDTAVRQGIGPGVIRAWRATTAGIPTAFTEADGANRPSASGATHVLTSPDVRLDATGVAHLLFVNETDATLVYRTFSTATDSWGPSTVVASGVKVPTTAFKRESLSSIVLDGNEVPHIVYVAGGSLLYRNRIGGAWSTAVTLSTGTDLLHPMLATEASGIVRAAWLDDGGSPVVRYKERAADGTWGATEAVASTDVLSNSNSDQGPSLVVSQNGVPYVLYVSALPGSAVRVKYRTGTGWAFDNPPSDVYTHTPQIYGRGNDVYVFLGHDNLIRYGYLYHLSGQPWSSYIPLTSTADGQLDGSASVRWDPLHETNVSVIDTSFFDEDKLDNGSFQPELYYMAVLPTVPDTQPPSAPGSLLASGSIGSVGLSWGAAVDDVGVTAYDVYRSTTPGFTPSLSNRVAQASGTAYTDAGLAPGTYYYRVAAQDAAGNVGPPSNEAFATVTADATAPSVAITAPVAGATVTGTVAVTADASDNVGVPGVQFLLDGSNLGAEDMSSPWSVSWDTTTAANGTHILTARARDAAGNGTTSAQVSVTVGNAAGGAVLLGDQTLYPGVDSDPPRTAEAFRTTAVSSGALRRLVVYVDSTSTATSLVVGVYGDLGGHPGSLLAQATSAPVNGAWNTIAVPAASIASGTSYWIALLAPKGTVRFRDRSCGCANPSETSAQTNLTTLPATWTTGIAYKDAPASAYGSS